MARRVVLAAVLVVSANACDTGVLGLHHEITLAATIDERRRPVELRERFSLEDEFIYVHVAIPPESAGPETRDFHFELFDGLGSIVDASGIAISRGDKPDWLVVSGYRINPEIDAPGTWALDVYVDGRRVDVVRFPVTATAREPLPDEIPPNDCCAYPSARQMTSQVLLSTGVDERHLILTGRRERFTLSDGRMYVYLRLLNVPDGDHTLRFAIYDGEGKPRGGHEQKFTTTSRRRISWAWQTLQGSAVGIWRVDVYLDGNLLGSVDAPVDR